MGGRFGRARPFCAPAMECEFDRGKGRGNRRDGGGEFPSLKILKDSF